MSILKQFAKIVPWKRHHERAPHKPLLILYALGRWAGGDRGDIPFSDVNRDLAQLLKEFGPSRRSQHPEYPFWRLQRDGVWTVRAPENMRQRESNSDPLKSELLTHHARACFSDDVKAALNADPKLAGRIAACILQKHFPETIHPDILSAVGLHLGIAVTASKKRDPHFRLKVLTAYEYRCAVCGFDIRLGTVSVALDAAHIQWHQAGGPSKESNGLALCVLHHKIFDLGAFTLSPEGLLLVSDQANGSAGFQETLLAHHGKKIRMPQRPEWAPHGTYIGWHGKEVFKGEARHLAA